VPNNDSRTHLFIIICVLRAEKPGEAPSHQRRERHRRQRTQRWPKKKVTRKKYAGGDAPTDMNAMQMGSHGFGAPQTGPAAGCAIS